MSRQRKRGSEVREPLQVYLTADERALLDRLAAEYGISRAEVLRRGIRAFALDAGGDRSAVLTVLSSLIGDDWPSDLASEHDAHLADAYRGR
ncbi:MAG TPA: ribbon-helix-helix protein, CopG family [Gemmatimonadales bacterium]